MLFSTLFQNAIKNLLRNKRRSFLTMLGIIIGISSVITIVSLGKGFEHKMIKEFTGDNNGKFSINVGFMHNNMMDSFTNQEVFTHQDKALIDRIPYVKSSEFVYMEDKVIVKPIRLGSTKLNAGIIKEPYLNDIEFGRGLRKEDSISLNKVAIISSKIAKEEFESDKEALGQSIHINNDIFTIVGVDKKFDASKNQVIIPENTYNQYFESSIYPVGINISLIPDSELKIAIDEIQTVLNENGSSRYGGSYMVLDSEGLAQSLSNVLNMLTGFIVLVSSVALFVASVGVMNMVYTSVSEREKEIGIKRALGAKRSDIRKEFLLEGVLLTTIGGILGYIIGMLCAVGISQLLQINVKPDITIIIVSVIISILIGVLASLIPSKRAANKNTIDVLK